jgi:hypothetical protein
MYQSGLQCDMLLCIFSNLLNIAKQVSICSKPLTSLLSCSYSLLTTVPPPPPSDLITQTDQYGNSLSSSVAPQVMKNEESLLSQNNASKMSWWQVVCCCLRPNAKRTKKVKQRSHTQQMHAQQPSGYTHTLHPL